MIATALFSMASVECTIHLIALHHGKSSDNVAELIRSGSDATSHLIKGRPHGWIHPPQKNDTKELLAHDWDLFLLTDSTATISTAVAAVASAHLAVEVAISRAQYETIKSSMDSVRVPIPETPPLPKEWLESGGVPQSAINNSIDASRQRRVGELQLDIQMAEFLSASLPDAVRNMPVSLFNLFRYPYGDSSVHDAYMEGFKQKFGPAAGAGIRFMGPVKSGITIEGDTAAGERSGWDGGLWQDANLVQYDSIWHYAYMLSTDVYQELNQQKMEGLEDTCILCVSEVELLRCRSYGWI